MCIRDRFDPGEFMFPKWEELIKNIKYYISQGTDDEDIIDDILTVMALDNESENVLDDIVENANALAEKETAFILTNLGIVYDEVAQYGDRDDTTALKYLDVYKRQVPL